MKMGFALAIPRMSRAVPWYIAFFVFFSLRTSADEALANPMEKVIELLEVLAKQIEKEGQDDASIYTIYTKYYKNQTKTSNEIIKDHGNKIAQLTADLKEAEAFREGKNKDLVDLANKLAKSEAELTSGRDNRKKEREVFEKNEATYIESLEQLNHALEVLAKKAPTPIAASSSSSLLSIAEKLKSTLTEGSDITLSTAQRETLDGFMRAAAVQNSAAADSPSSFRKINRAEALEPSFLQTESNLRGPYGEYKSQSTGLISTLQDLYTKVKNERDAALTEEEKAKKDFKDWESSLVTMIENGKKSLADIKTTIAQSQETSSQKQASLMEAKDIFKAETEHLEQVEAEYRGKTQAYKIRLGKRSDEAIAVHEAQRIMASEVAKGYIKQQTIGTTGNGTFFLQYAQEKHKVMRKAIQVLKVAPTPGLALLAMKTTVHFRHKHKAHADPFAKVKKMIDQMITRLLNEANEDAQHEGFCDKEFGKNKVTRTKLSEDIDGLQAAVEDGKATIMMLTEEIATLSQEVADLDKSMAEATKLRTAEKAKNKVTVEDAVDAQKAVAAATAVLKEFYEKASLATGLLQLGAERPKMGTAEWDSLANPNYKGPVDKGQKIGASWGHQEGMQTFGEKYTGMQDSAGGVMALLEVCLSDFANLEAETKAAEASAQEAYDTFMVESEKTKATKVKKIEMDNADKAAAEAKLQEDTKDLKGTQDELLAADRYYEKLVPQCIDQGMTWEERVAARQAEINSLKEALKILDTR
mmetsp:Transcript_86837/g.135973  ORF Transcript_86837/g.135973 Transcript_86837/m.135973 type:complete len:756 (+) Transcript_86837:30-2297(+)